MAPERVPFGWKEWAAVVGSALWLPSIAVACRVHGPVGIIAGLYAVAGLLLFLGTLAFSFWEKTFGARP